MPGKDVDKRRRIVKRIAQGILRDGFYVNLGISVPTLVANYVPAGMDVILQSENGMLGIGPYPVEGKSCDLINAGKETVSEMAGTTFSRVPTPSRSSWRTHRPQRSRRHGSRRRGQPGQLDDPEKNGEGMGGAMDLVAGARRVIIAMEHTTKDLQPKILKKCTLPLTGVRVVNMIVTEMAVIHVTPAGLLPTRSRTRLECG